MKNCGVHKGSPARGAGSAQPRLRGCRRFVSAVCLRRPYLFSRKRKDRGEKSAWTRLVPPCGERKSKAPLKGELSAKLTERLPQICCDLSVTAPPCHLPCQGRLEGHTSMASPMRGSCRRRRLMRWTVPRGRNCPHLIRHGSAVPPSPRRGRQGGYFRLRIAAMNSGVVPQQPPRRAAPLALRACMWRTKSSGPML